MGQVVELKLPIEKVITEDDHAKAVAKLQAKIKAQRAEIRQLKARNAVLVELLQDPYNEHVRLLNVQMRREEAERIVERSCTCIPDRARALRRSGEW